MITFWWVEELVCTRSHFRCNNVEHMKWKCFAVQNCIAGRSIISNIIRITCLASCNECLRNETQVGMLCLQQVVLRYLCSLIVVRHTLDYQMNAVILPLFAVAAVKWSGFRLRSAVQIKFTWKSDDASQMADSLEIIYISHPFEWRNHCDTCVASLRKRPPTNCFPNDTICWHIPWASLTACSR